MINLDSKADQFVMDENMDYITNRPKKPVETIEPQAVHEGFEVSGKTYSGEINALFEKLIDKLKEQAKKDDFDKTKMQIDAYNALITEFTTALTAKVQENPAILSSGSAVVKEADDEVVPAMKNMNYSGGPIPTKNYDIPDVVEEEQTEQPKEPDNNNQQQDPQNPSNPSNNENPSTNP